jgi:RNA recognition motif-containing protein
MNLYVGNLAPDVTEQELRLEFEAFGEVTSVIIIKDKYTGKGQTGGHGFVEMAIKSDGTAAVAALKGKILKNKPIDIVEALPLSDKKMAITTVQKEKASGSRGGRRRY